MKDRSFLTFGRRWSPVCLAGVVFAFGPARLIAGAAAAAPEPPVIGVRLPLDAKQPLRPNVYGVNCELLSRPFTHLQPGFMQKCAEADRPFFRYPGGTGANYFNPLTGLLASAGKRNYESLNEKIKGMNGGKGADPFKFFQFARETQTDYSLVLNMGSVSLDENRRWLESVAQAGYKPHYFELGNELYFGTYSQFFADGRAYADHAEKTAKMIRSIFPDARIGVVISSLYYVSDSFLQEDIPTSEQRHREWTQALQGKDFYDAVIIHLYTRLGMPSDIQAKDVWPFAKTYQQTLSYLDARFNSALDAVNADFPGKPIWVTEYGTVAFNSDVLKNYGFPDSYWGSMHTTDMTLKLFGRPDVELANRHSFARFVTWSRQTGEDGRLPKDASFGITNAYRHFTIIGPAVRNSADFVKPQLEGVLNYRRAVDDGDSPEVEAGCFVAGDHGYLILINKMTTTYTLDKVRSQSGGAEAPVLWTTGLQLAPRQDVELDKALADVNEMSSLDLNGANTQTLTLPPYSVTRLELRFSK